MHDLRSEPDPRARATELAAHLAAAAIPTERAPLWRARIARLDTDAWLAILVVHHAVFDAASCVLLQRELTQLCRMRSAGGVPDLPALAVRYADMLPEHMVPTAVVALDALPLTSNGKLDRAALPAPSSAGNAERPRVGPRTDLERLIARVWRDVLGIADTQPMGIDENFVDLGGHSLHAARVVAAIRRTTPDLRRASVLDLFAHPTVRELAAFTAGAPARCCTS